MINLYDAKFKVTLMEASKDDKNGEYMTQSTEKVIDFDKVKDITLLGATSPVGFSESDIIIQFTKPCFGFFVIKLKSEVEEIKKLRDQYKKDKNVKKIK